MFDDRGPPIDRLDRRAGGRRAPSRAFTVRLYAEAYDGRCETYERDPANILRHLWAGNISLRRDTCLRVRLGSDRFAERYHPDREFGMRLLEAGVAGVFDRDLRATHL